MTTSDPALTVRYRLWMFASDLCVWLHLPLSWATACAVKAGQAIKYPPLPPADRGEDPF